MITASDFPFLNVGDGFTGGLSYSTTDRLTASGGGVYEYDLTTLGDVVFFSYSTPFGPATLSSDVPLSVANIYLDPALEEFAAVSGFNQGIFEPVEPVFYGNSHFLSSGALPDPLHVGDITSGTVAFAFLDTPIGYVESGQGEITAVYLIPEPRDLGLAAGIFALISAVCGRRFVVS